MGLSIGQPEINEESIKPTTGRGGRRPGSGRPRGGKKATTIEMERLARECAPAAFATLKLIAAKGRSEPARIAAATAILDRAYGKPRQALEHSGEDGGPVEMLVTHEVIDPSAS